MQRFIRFSILAITLLAFVSVGFAKGPTRASNGKKVKTFSLTQDLPHSAEKVWHIIGVDYGAVAYSHPKIISSSYINGSKMAKEGAERQCFFNEKGTQYLKEKIVNYNPEQMSYVNTISQAGKFPVDPEVTTGLWKVERLSDNSSRVTVDIQLRTKPAMMSGMMKSSFKKLLEDYFIAIDHHLRTGEKVTKENFKDIKKEHKKMS